MFRNHWVMKLGTFCIIICLFDRIITVPGGSRLTIPGQQEAILGPDGKAVTNESGVPIGVDQGMYATVLKYSYPIQTELSKFI